MQKKSVFTVLPSLLALLVTFGSSAVATPSETLASSEVEVPANVEGGEAEAAENLPEIADNVLVNGDAEPALDPATGEPVEAQAIVCNCRLGQPNNFCPINTSCQACPCFTTSGSAINGVCK